MRATPTMRRASPLLALTLLGSAGCAFEPGEPYGLVTAHLDVRYERLDDREAGEGFQQLDTDFQVRLTSASLVVDAVELLGAGADASIASFDPANPPPGYSACHGGHCHAADGSLVSYEDIAAELAHGGQAGLTAVASFHSLTTSLLDPTPAALSCTASCALPRSQLAMTTLTVHELALKGDVRDGRADPRFAGVQPWQVDLGMHEHGHDHETDDPHDSHEDEPDEDPHGVFEAPMDLVVDEDEPSRISLTIALLPSSTLLDGIDFSAIPANADGVLELTHETADEAVEQLLHHFDELHLHLETSRTDD